MHSTQPLLADRFAILLDGLCRAVAARMARNPAAVPLLLLLWGRLRRTMVRFSRLAGRVQDGTPKPRQQQHRRRGPGPKGDRLPTGFAWLVRLVPEAAISGSQLQHLLTDPEMAALLAAAPQAGRILRPLCRMLGAQPTPVQLPPPPPRPARLPQPPKPVFERAQESGKSCRPARPRGPPAPGLASFRLARLYAPL